MPPHQELPTDVADRIKALAQAMAEAEHTFARSRDRLHSAIYAAVRDDGNQVTAVAAAAGVSRETVHKVTGQRWLGGPR